MDVYVVPSRKERKLLEKTLKEMQDAGEDTYELEEQLEYFDEVDPPQVVAEYIFGRTQDRERSEEEHEEGS